MFLTRSEYDRGVNTFSPEGRIFQVEYAIEVSWAVNQQLGTVRGLGRSDRLLQICLINKGRPPHPLCTHPRPSSWAAQPLEWRRKRVSCWRWRSVSPRCSW